MIFQITEKRFRIVRRGLVCLALGGAILALALKVEPGRSANVSSLSPAEESVENISNRSRLGDKILLQSRSRRFNTRFPQSCATSFSRQALANPCFLQPGPQPPVRPARSVEIPIYFHVLVDSHGAGRVSTKAIQEQIRFLNTAFAGHDPPGGAPTPFRFVLQETDVTVNDLWFYMSYSEDNPSAAERAAKTLNKGGKSALNIYTAAADGTLGWARWPWQFDEGVDGVVLLHSALPGGASTNYNLGDVLVHEVGHWLGLFHTSFRGCSMPGDCVDDTFAEANRKTYCPTGYDTCQGQGPDPYENFMNDTYDSCKYKFTAGQAARMDAIHRLYRT